MFLRSLSRSLLSNISTPRLVSAARLVLSSQVVTPGIREIQSRGGEVAVFRSMASQALPQEPPRESHATIVHDSASHKFMTCDGQAFAEYDLLSPSQAAASSEASLPTSATSAGKGGGETSGVKRGVMDITHTYVPASRRGEGLAARLCEAACDYAKENGLYVRPTCSYVEVRATHVPPT
ncbi:unnamed protein product [Closterium sp. NIES-54]